MTAAQIREAILSNSWQGKTACEIAELLNVPKTVLTERMIGIGTVLDVLGPAAGSALLEQFETLAQSDIVVKWGWKLLEKQMLDVGLASTRQFLHSALPPGAAGPLLALAEQPDPVSEYDVRRALLADDGTWRV